MNINYVNKEQLKKRRSPLHVACRNNDMKKVNELLKDSKTKLNARDIKGYTPLMFAANNGHLKIVEKLCKTRGVKINAKGDDNGTALFFAAIAGNGKIVELLVKHGGKIFLNQGKKTLKKN